MGEKSNQEGHEIIPCIGKMEDSETTLVYFMSKKHPPLTTDIEISSTIRVTVKHEVHQELARTNASLVELKAPILSSPHQKDP